MFVVKVARRATGFEVACEKDGTVVSEEVYVTGAEALEGTLECVRRNRHDEPMTVEVLGRGVVGASRDQAIVTSILRLQFLPRDSGDG